MSNYTLAEITAMQTAAATALAEYLKTHVEEIHRLLTAEATTSFLTLLREKLATLPPGCRELQELNNVVLTLSNARNYFTARTAENAAATPALFSFPPAV
jgi:hypothetical protein